MMHSFKNIHGARDLGKIESFSNKRMNSLKIINEFYFTDINRVNSQSSIAHSVSSPILYGKKIQYFFTIFFCVYLQLNYLNNALSINFSNLNNP